MDVVISPGSNQPIYLQIAEQLAAQILRGDLTEGAALPPIRTIARQLEVSVITVKKAWEELERAGLIHAIVGKGSFVAPRPAGELRRDRDKVVMERLAKDLPFYQDLGLTEQDFLDLVRQAWGAR